MSSELSSRLREDPYVPNSNSFSQGQGMCITPSVGRFKDSDLAPLASGYNSLHMNYMFSPTRPPKLWQDQGTDKRRRVANNDMHRAAAPSFSSSSSSNNLGVQVISSTSKEGHVDFKEGH